MRQARAAKLVLLPALPSHTPPPHTWPAALARALAVAAAKALALAPAPPPIALAELQGWGDGCKHVGGGWWDGGWVGWACCMACIPMHAASCLLDSVGSAGRPAAPWLIVHWPWVQQCRQVCGRGEGGRGVRLLPQASCTQCPTAPSTHA